MAFDFLDGDGIANNSATITQFSTDGILGAATATGGVTGTLPGPLTLADTAFTNEFLQSIRLGSRIDFTLEYTENFAGGFPDGFSLFLFDDSFQPLFDTTDPTGAAVLLVVDLDGSAGGTLTVFAGNPADLRPQAVWTVTAAQVPEPGEAWLWGAGLALWRFTAHRRTRRLRTARLAQAQYP